MDPYLGEVRMFGFDFEPRGWAFCNGQSMLIQQYAALFSLLGVTFGGNGTTNFNLPNLQGRVPMAAGAGTGLTVRTAGVQVGKDAETLDTTTMPWHTHSLTAQNADSAQTGPASASLAKGGIKSGRVLNPWNTYVAGPTNTPASNLAISITGQGQAHENRQPVQIVNYCIALNGIFPPRP
jgi:microcystin-dependent protein